MKSIITLTFCAAILLIPANGFADEWSFELEPYLLASSIDGDAGLGRITGADVAVDFGDILNTLDLGGMIHFEVHHTGGWGVSLDYGFMNLGADIAGPAGGITDAEVRQGVLELLLHRRVGSVEYLAGLRWWDNDVDLTVDPLLLPGTAEFSVEKDWVDLVIGARWTRPLNERWKLLLRGDVGGFGLQSDFTASASAGLHFEINELLDLDLQYKATWVDFEEGSPGRSGYFAYDTTTHGPIVGLIFNF